MAETKIDFLFKNAYGYEIRVTVVEWNEATSAWIPSDISSFTTKEFKIVKPDKTSQTLTAEFEGDGSDGVLIKIITVGMGLLDQVGWYSIQATVSSGSQYFPTQISGFKVDDPL